MDTDGDVSTMWLMRTCEGKIHGSPEIDDDQGKEVRQKTFLGHLRSFSYFPLNN